MTARNQSLDVLRGVAVLGVLFCHCGMNPQFLNKGDSHQVFAFGGIGVDLFFVLSGFLISGLLFSEFQRTGSISLQRFFIRRGFKIYPPFYVFMALTPFLVGPHRPMIWESMFLQDYSTPFWVHTWSLAIEEQFYLMLPVLLILLVWLQPGKGNPFKVVPLISIALSAICLYLRIKTFRLIFSHPEPFGQPIHALIHPLHLRIDALFAGVALGYFAHFDKESFSEAKRMWVVIVGLLGLTVTYFVDNLLELTVGYVAFAFIVAWAVLQRPSKNLLLRALAWIGFYSYSIYLWHVVAMMAFLRWHLWISAYIAIALGLGIIMAKLIEVPALRLRNRWFVNVVRPKADTMMVPCTTTTQIAR